MSAVLDVELAAEPASAARSRRAMSDWLSSLCGLAMLCDVGHDLVLAVNEAISNSVEHAYRGGPGTISLRASVRAMTRPDEHGHCGGLEVCVEVRDNGRWREPPTDPGFRGRGLMMVRASVDLLRIERTPRGTVVTLRRSLGCPVPA